MPEVAQDKPATAPRGLAEQLRAFRQSHAYTRRTVGGVDWEYNFCGRGHEALLLLPGGMSSGESLYRHIVELEDEFRLLAPSYPAVGTMCELSDGLAAILEAEGTATVHVVGGSYGGLVAQAFAFHHPQRVLSLTLSHTGGPDPRRGSILKILLELFAIFPASWMKAAFRAKIRGLLRHPDLEQAERQFLEAYLAENLALLSPQALDAAYARVVDFCLHYPAQQPVWTGTTLILESDDDPAVRPGDRARLKANYPQAQVHTFHGTGHLAAVLRLQEYLDVQRKFLRAASAESLRPSNSLRARA